MGYKIKNKKKLKEKSIKMNRQQKKNQCPSCCAKKKLEMNPIVRKFRNSVKSTTRRNLMNF